MVMICERVNESLRRIIGKLGSPKSHVIDKKLETAYRQMAQDEEQETEALEWVEGLVGAAEDQRWKSSPETFRFQ
jgi:hypothetical protein